MLTGHLLCRPSMFAPRRRSLGLMAEVVVAGRECTRDAGDERQPAPSRALGGMARAKRICLGTDAAPPALRPSIRWPPSPLLCWQTGACYDSRWSTSAAAAAAMVAPEMVAPRARRRAAQPPAAAAPASSRSWLKRRAAMPCSCGEAGRGPGCALLVKGAEPCLLLSSHTAPICPPAFPLASALASSPQGAGALAGH